MHNFGIAWDIGIFRGKEYIGDHALYAKVGKLYNQVPGNLPAAGVLLQPAAYGSRVARVPNVNYDVFACGAHSLKR